MGKFKCARNFMGSSSAFRSAACLIGFLPRCSVVIWGYIIYSFFSYFGQLMKLPKIVKHLDVFFDLLRLPVDLMNWGHISILFFNSDNFAYCRIFWLSTTRLAGIVSFLYDAMIFTEKFWFDILKLYFNRFI